MVPKKPSIKKLDVGGRVVEPICDVGELSKLVKLLLTKLVVVVVMGGGPGDGTDDTPKSKSPSKSSKFDAAGTVDTFGVTTGAAKPPSKLSSPPSRLSKDVYTE